MSNLVIVAIPDENDRVWKVSSEKVPHLTLLFLGDLDQVSNPNKIVEFVDHAASTTLKRFYLTVDRRGELGDDEADVLFFKKGYDYKAVRDFRAALLQDNNIRTAYDSATQFEGPWTPHLTLGYPGAPAKPEDDNWGGFYSVEFNKISVWVNDYDGPEFLLKDYWDEYETLDAVPMDVAMSSVNDARTAAGLEVLEHFGVKGMRWGVRKAKDARFVTGANSTRTINKLVSGAANATKEKDLPGINAKYAAKGAKTSTRPHLQSLSSVPVQKAYRNEVRNAYRKRLEETANSMTNASGTKKYEISEPRIGTGSATRWRVKARQVQHAVDDDLLTEFEVEPVYNDDGFITDIVVVQDSMAQTADLGVEFLEHFGVKGMKWGQRRQRSSGGAGGSTSPSRTRKVGRGLKKVAKDIYFESDWATDSARSKISSAASKTWAEQDVPRLNAQYKGTKAATLKGRLKNPLDKDTIEYRSRSRAAFRDRLNEEVAKLPTNVSGTRRYEIEDGGSTNANYFWHVKAVDVKRRSGLDHAATDDDVVLEDFRVRPTFDADGLIIGFKQIPIEDDVVAQSATDIGAQFVLEHFGVKGMRWGSRKAAPVAVTPTSTSRVPHGTKRKTKIKVEGGQNHPAHEDAIKVAESRAKLSKSGTAALSNKELRDVANRLQLEQQVTSLAASRGRKFVRRQFETETEDLGRRVIRKGTRKVIKFA